MTRDNKNYHDERIEVVRRNKYLMRLIKIAISIYPQCIEKDGIMKRKVRDKFERIIDLEELLEEKGLKISAKNMVYASCFVYYLFKGAMRFEKRYDK